MLNLTVNHVVFTAMLLTILGLTILLVVLWFFFIKDKQEKQPELKISEDLNYNQGRMTSEKLKQKFPEYVPYYSFFCTKISGEDQNLRDFLEKYKGVRDVVVFIGELCKKFPSLTIVNSEPIDKQYNKQFNKSTIINNPLKTQHNDDKVQVQDGLHDGVEIPLGKGPHAVGDTVEFDTNETYSVVSEPEPVVHEPVIHRYFFSIPDAYGQFDDKYKSESEDNTRLYKITVMDHAITGTIEYLVGKRDKTSISGKGDFLKPACTIENELFENPVGIILVKAGSVVLRDGKWCIDHKIVLRFS